MATHHKVFSASLADSLVSLTVATSAAYNARPTLIQDTLKQIKVESTFFYDVGALWFKLQMNFFNVIITNLWLNADLLETHQHLRE
jgi:hypothetical protein